MRYIVTIFYLIVVALWALFVLVSAAVVTALTFWWDKRRKIIHTYTRFSARTAIRLCPLWRMEVEGEENLDRSRPYVITSNHLSFFDIAAVICLVRVYFRFVSKWEVFRIPVIGQLLSMRDDIVIHRGRSSATTTLMHKGFEHLKQGTSVAIFPEGTRSKDRQVHKFKLGAFRLAQEAQVGIQPCVLDNTDTAMSLKRGVFKNTFRLRILPPISAEQVAATTPHQMASDVEQLTIAELAKMRAAKNNNKR